MAARPRASMTIRGGWQLPAEALFVIPCSGRKVSGGQVAVDGDSILDLLPGSLADRLREARQRHAPKAHLDESMLLPARSRYDGTLYRAAGPGLATGRLVIISGGYGLVLRDEPIGIYDRPFSLADWPPSLLQDCLLAVATEFGTTSVVAFCAATTGYAALMRTTPWTARGIAARLASPTLGGRRGAQVLVPRATGEALRAAIEGSLDEEWRSSDGVGLRMEELSQ